MAEMISSAANPLVKRVRSLADRKHRRRESAFVVQGIQPVWQAVEAGAEVEVIIVAPGLLRHPGAVAMVAERETAGVRVATVSDELFGRISDRDAPSGLAAIVRATPAPLADMPVRADSVFAVLHEVGNPGNLGTIIRTANAAGVSAVITIGPSADPYDPAAVKASMGALFAMPVAQATSADQFFEWAATSGITVAATSARGSATCWDAELPLPIAFMLGSEGAGLPEEVLDRADVHVRIPMVGTAESLNLAAAAAVLLFELPRRRASGQL
jgi:RNA methyltransferase, TrmH family